jgi:predicted 3-demethylubiquinone-9 3-methyltransferase (glyoxalase superfamily)
MQKITTFLWYDKEAEEAAKFYCSIFKKSKILGTPRNLERTRLTRPTC